MSKESWYNRSLQQPRKTQRPEENKKRIETEDECERAFGENAAFFRDRGIWKNGTRVLTAFEREHGLYVSDAQQS